MLQRQPYLPRFMAGGPSNPLGARAMYLGGTVYRIDGTNAPETYGSPPNRDLCRSLRPQPACYTTNAGQETPEYSGGIE